MVLAMYEALENLTVVLPVFERQHLIFRQSDYWRRTNAQLIILDGSSSPLPPVKLKKLEENRNLQYLYSHESFASRMNKVGQMKTKPYIVLTCDDYFLLKSSLCKAIEELEKDKSFVGCGGQRLFVSVGRRNEKLMYSFFHNTFENYQVDSKIITQRLFNAFQSYNGVTNFAVMRSDVWKKSWGSITDSFSSTNIYEMQQAFIAHSLGKFSTIATPYMLCSDEYERINNHEDNRDLLFEKWWKAEEYLNERNYFIEVLSNFCNSNLAIQVPAAHELVLDVFNAFSKSKSELVTGKNSLMRSRIKNYKRFPNLDFSLNYLPKNFRKFLRKHYLGYIEKQTYFPLELMFKKVWNFIEVTPDNMNDLYEIEKLINDSHKNKL